MAKVGHIKLHRGWEDSDLFQDGETYCERAAWVWLLSNAAWKSCVRAGPKGAVISLKRGQFHTSKRTLGRVWGWDAKRVVRFLDRLERAKMLHQKRDQSGTLLTICKYDKYQDQPSHGGTAMGIGRGTSSGPARDQLGTTQEEGKEGKEVTLAKANDSELSLSADPPASGNVLPFDPDAAFWASAKAYLRPFAKGDPGALVGKWVRDFGRTAAAAAISEAQVSRAVEPISYIERVLRGAKQSYAEPAVPL